MIRIKNGEQQRLNLPKLREELTKSPHYNNFAEYDVVELVKTSKIRLREALNCHSKYDMRRNEVQLR